LTAWNAPIFRLLADLGVLHRGLQAPAGDAGGLRGRERDGCTTTACVQPAARGGRAVPRAQVDAERPTGVPDHSSGVHLHGVPARSAMDQRPDGRAQQAARQQLVGARLERDRLVEHRAASATGALRHRDRVDAHLLHGPPHLVEPGVGVALGGPHRLDRAQAGGPLAQAGGELDLVVGESD
jgi:hypothetical protein